MKKLLVAGMAVVALMSGNSVMASEEGQWSFALDVAPAISWLGTGDNNEVDGDGARMKINPGLTVYYNFGNENRYSAFTGLNLNSFGGWLKGTPKSNVVASERVRYAFQEMEIPVGVRFRTGAYGSFRFAVHLNLGLGIPVSGKAYDYSVSPVQVAGLSDIEDGDNGSYSTAPVRMTYGLAVGTEYDLDFVVLTGKIRYKGSLTNMYFHNDGPFTAAKALNLADKDGIYNKGVAYRPSLLELAIGVIF